MNPVIKNGFYPQENQFSGFNTYYSYESATFYFRKLPTLMENEVANNPDQVVRLTHYATDQELCLGTWKSCSEQFATSPLNYQDDELISYHSYYYV